MGRNVMGREVGIDARDRLGNAELALLRTDLGRIRVGASPDLYASAILRA